MLDSGEVAVYDDPLIVLPLDFHPAPPIPFAPLRRSEKRKAISFPARSLLIARAPRRNPIDAVDYGGSTAGHIRWRSATEPHRRGLQRHAGRPLRSRGGRRQLASPMAAPLASSVLPRSG